MTNDEFYDDHPEFTDYRSSYTGYPDINSVWKALTLDANGVYQPKFEYSSLANFAAVQAKFKGANTIPAEYLGVLPGIPRDPNAPIPVNPFAPAAPAAPNVPRRAVGNETYPDWDAEYYAGADGHGDDGDANLEEYDDAELDAWIESYMAWAKSQQESSNTVAPRNDDARATPVGQGEPVQTPATKRSAADAEMPAPTVGPRY